MKSYLAKNLSEAELMALLKRPGIDFKAGFEAARSVIAQVRVGGDQTLKELTEKFDCAKLNQLLVSEKEIESASEQVGEELKEAIDLAYRNIEKFHKAQLPKKIEVETMPGVKCSREYRALERVGLYIPGGTAPLFSTMLMLAIPAQIAGVKEMVLCTPPREDGSINETVLYTAKRLGIEKVFKLGGAQAVAAMAYGTESVPKVQKICGPGNQYVTAAKSLVAMDPAGAAIDMPAGPTEVVVIADQEARADFVAADLLSQAEHGMDSQVVLLSNSEEKVSEVLAEVEKQLSDLPRTEIVCGCLKNSYGLVLEDLDACLEFSNRYAPEHLVMNMVEAHKYVPEIQSAGSVFLGPWSCESAGDYASGTNHTLPTYGYATMYGGVSVDTFVKKITFQELSEEGVRGIGPAVELMAEAEGLDAHKRAMTIRLSNLK